jgi:RNA polymerase sigma-70 factor (ECF subfamily)
MSFSDMPDENLMDFVQAGNERAFETLVKRHHDRFYRQIYRWVLHAQDAEDIVQASFLKLWSGKARWKINQGARFTTWFYRILYNHSIDVLRSRRRTMEELKEDLPDGSQSSEQALIDKRQQIALRAALMELPERQRIAINLFYFEDMPQKNIATLMGISVKALESLLSRAKTHMRERMVEERTARYG